MAKGQVKLESFADRLRLRWSYRSKRYCLSLGLHDTQVNRRVAIQKAQQIELDMISDNFDISLDKYKPEPFEKEPEPKKVLGNPQTFSEAFEKHWGDFVIYKQRRVENPFTIISMYSPLEKKLKTFKQKIVGKEEATVFIEELLAQISPTTVKKYLNTLNNFCNWLQENELVEDTWKNPFKGLKQLCKPRPTQKPPPFTLEEIRTIIAGFEKDKYYAHYLGYVRFLFMTGCRTSEAIGLQWKHISKNCSEITFMEASVRKDTGTGRLRKSTKTNRTRKFPCNKELQKLLRSIRPKDYNLDQLVFPSPSGKSMDATNFLNRPWTKVLGKCGMTKENGLYRCQYNTRHTFISHMLAKGMSVVEVAKLTGHDPKVLLDHYADVIHRVNAPAFF